MPKDTTFVRRGQHLPRNKHGVKPGYYPERHLTDPNAKPTPEMRPGKSRRVSGGYVQGAYSVPLTAPVHQSRTTGKVYSSVFHKWHTGSKGKVTPKATVFDKTLRVEQEQFTAHNITTNLWRKWTNEGTKE